MDHSDMYHQMYPEKKSHVLQFRWEASDGMGDGMSMSSSAMAGGARKGFS